MDNEKSLRPLGSPAPQAGQDRGVCPNPGCEYDKHAKDANFCVLCGTLLYRRWDDCQVANPRYARFCFYCGTDLDEVRAQGKRREEPEPPPFGLTNRQPASGRK